MFRKRVGCTRGDSPHVSAEGREGMSSFQIHSSQPRSFLQKASAKLQYRTRPPNQAKQRAVSNLAAPACSNRLFGYLSRHLLSSLHACETPSQDEATLVKSPSCGKGRDDRDSRAFSGETKAKCFPAIPMESKRLRLLHTWKARDFDERMSG